MWYVDGTGLSPEAMAGEGEDADLLLTIDPLGPGTPGGPITPRSP